VSVVRHPSLALFAIAAVVATACTSHSAGERVMPTDPCHDALSQFLAKDLSTWRGLPHCTLAGLAPLELGSDETVTVLGEAKAQVVYRRARTTTYAEVLTVWLRAGAVVRISVELPALPDVPGLLQALGPPDAKLDAWRATVAVRSPESEWVWAARGLALVLSSDRSNVLQLIVYPPMVLDTYRAQVRFDEPPRERSM
jgi:hypothetical protein